MNISVLGAGSWGTTVATIVAKRNDTMLWARNAEVAEEINKDHTNESYLAGFTLPDRLQGTSDLEEAAAHADVLVWLAVVAAVYRPGVEAVKGGRTAAA